MGKEESFVELQNPENSIYPEKALQTIVDAACYMTNELKHKNLNI